MNKIDRCFSPLQIAKRWLLALSFVLCVVLAAWAIGQQQQSREQLSQQALQLRLLESLVLSPTTAVITTNCKGQVESWNGGASRLFGYTESQMIGQNIEKIMSAPSRAKHRDRLAAYLAIERGKSPHYRPCVIPRCAACRKDGKCFDVHVSVRPVSHLGQVHLLAVIDAIEDLSMPGSLPKS